MRIVVHDYSGHLFQFQLSRELARLGHETRHYFFADYPGPQGPKTRRLEDPPLFSVHSLSTGGAYQPDRFVQRGLKNVAYGRMMAREIRKFRPDVVIAGNTPLETQHFMIEAAHAVDAAILFWVQDLQGIAIHSLLRKRWLGGGRAVGAAFLAMERAQARAVDGVVIISPGFREEIDKYGVEDERVAVIPNWGALADIPLRPKRNPWSEAHGLCDKIVVLYSGTMGLKHNPQMILALADSLKDRKDVVVVVAAEGAGKNAMMDSLKHTPRSNIMTLGLQPAEVFPDVLGGADIMVALLEADAGRFSVPSKILSYLCSGRPIVMAGPQENLSCELVPLAGAGFCVGATEAAGFAEKVRLLASDPGMRAAKGAAARRYAEENFDIERVAPKFVTAFEGAIARRRSARR